MDDSYKPKGRVMRRTFSALIVALLSAVLMLGAASPATAAGLPGAPPPAAVRDIPDLPSNTIRMTQTAAGGNWRAFTAADWFNYTGWKLSQPGTDLAVIPQTGKTVAVVPKPITPGAAVTRAGSVGAGSVLVAGNLGWAIGQGGLVAYSAMTGQDYGTMMCGTPDWYQATNSFLMMGVAPDCAALVPDPNADMPAAGTLTYGGASVSIQGYRLRSGFSYLYSCLTVGGSLPTGYHYQSKASNSSTWTNGAPSPIGTNTYCSSASGIYSGGPFPTASHWSTTALNSTQSFRVVRTSDGAVVATTSETKKDPNRTASCTIGWKDGTSTTGTGITYKESTGVPLSASSLGCKSAWDAKPGAGREVMPDRIGVDSTDDAGAKTEISGQNVPDFSPTERIALDPTLGNGRGLVLEKVVDGATLSCMTWAADCAQWWTTTSEGTSEGPYRCTYGGAAVAIAQCGPYRHTFDTKTNSPTITDPTTGNSVDWQSVPDTSNSISPGTGPGTGNNPAGECFANGWSAFNPLEWVLTPVKCAIVWAFVPRTSVVTTHTSAIDAKWRATGVGGLTTAIGAWTFVPPANGCSGLVMPLGSVYGHGVQDVRILSACAGDPLQPIAALSTVVLTIASVLGLIFALTRFFGGIFGARGLGDGTGA